MTSLPERLVTRSSFDVSTWVCWQERSRFSAFILITYFDHIAELDGYIDGADLVEAFFTDLTLPIDIREI